MQFSMGTLRKEHRDGSSNRFRSGNSVLFAISVQRPDLVCWQVDDGPHTISFNDNAVGSTCTNYKQRRIPLIPANRWHANAPLPHDSNTPGCWIRGQPVRRSRSSMVPTAQVGLASEARSTTKTLAKSEGRRRVRERSSDGRAYRIYRIVNRNTQTISTKCQ
jgi:hypothetical protein